MHSGPLTLNTGAIPGPMEAQHFNTPAPLATGQSFPAHQPRETFGLGFQLAKIRTRVHPSVILTMLDAHSRLQEPTEFAIGTLLGMISADVGNRGTSYGALVEVLDCFVNPYHWDPAASALTIHKEQHEWMLKLREKVNPKLTVVGWCCTTDTILYTTALSDWASSEGKVSRFVPSKALPQPLHILISPNFSEGRPLSILNQTKAYIRGPLRQLFHEVPLEIALNPADNDCAAVILKSSKPFSAEKHKKQGADKTCGQQQDLVSAREHLPLQDAGGNLVTALKKLSKFIDPCLEYIDSVLEGKQAGDATIGRAFMRSVCMETLLPQEEIEAMCEGAVQDNLMVAYLANLARLQVVIAERLNASFN